VLYIIALIVSLAMVVPIMRRAGRRLQEAEAAPGGGAGTAAAPANGNSAAGSSMSEYSLIGMSSGISAVLLLVIVILMVWKP
jgi:flagellar biosynthesis/type III secretory pathway M-ring protein FliF/YscJ